MAAKGSPRPVMPRVALYLAAITVVVGEAAHSTLSKSLGFVGLGRNRVVVVPADAQGRLRAERLPKIPMHRDVLPFRPRVLP